MGRRGTRIAVCVVLCALAAGGPGAGAAHAGAASPSADPAPAAADLTSAAPVDGEIAPVPVASSTGIYIVLLDEEPVATYGGGERRFPATAPADGEKLDPHSTRAQKYAAFLQSRQRAVADSANVELLATYQTVLNGFSANLSPDAAARLAATDGVLALYPDEIFRPDGVPAEHAPRTVAVPDPAVPDPALPDPADPDPADPDPADPDPADPDPADPDPALPDPAVPDPAVPASGGVVVGVIDTGIAPGNPSFRGDRLTTSRTAGAYLAGDAIVVPKADGREFRGSRLTGDDWTRSDYSTKLVGAQYFAAGVAASGFELDHDVLSPRDSDGHGSRVAGIAAGNAAVDVEIEGTEFGSISGAAPDAAVASYKACYTGRDPLSTADDICVGTDVLAALDRAVADGVDVLTFSLGREQPEQEWGAADIALLNAAVSGVFVAVSAGNGGPAPGTAHRGAPWFTTVAASTRAGFAAAVRLSDGFEAAGVSGSLRADAQVTGPIVYGGDVALDGSADARLCYRGTLDPELVTGRIVVCDRGTNPREEKAREVADAGGVGMVLVNVVADSLDAELDAVPTVHIDAGQRDALLAAIAVDPSATLTLAEDVDAPPRIAGFSGRGPSDPGDVLSPDVAAPGVSILAPSVETANGEPTWSVASGTSMAAASVAGTAATYLGAHPRAMPDEIKSALMTTAGDAVDADSSFAVDPFAQGAGAVDPDRARDPGLVYLNGPAQWRDYLAQRALGDSAPSEASGSLNLASIAIAELGPKHTVTRTLTASRAGTYEVAASVPGVEVTVSPSTLAFAAAGERKTYTVVFENESAPIGLWATGFLMWTAEDGTGVRSPLAVRPAAASATTLVTGEGTEGTADAQVVSGAAGELPLEAVGLAPVELLVDPDDPAPGHSGDAASGDANGRIGWVVSVPSGTALAEFALTPSASDDLGLIVYRLAPGQTGDGIGQQSYLERFEAQASAGRQRMALADPDAGAYLVVVDVSEAADDSKWDLTSAVVSGSSHSLSVAAESSSAVTAGEVVPYTLTWIGLDPGADYIGVVRHGDSAARTVVRVAAGSTGPTADAQPVIVGDPLVGEQVRVEGPGWTPADVSVAYQWLRDGEPIDGADASEYRIRAVDAGTSLTAQVTALRPGDVNAGVAVSDPVIVAAPATLELAMSRSVGAVDDRYAVTVAVTTAGGDPASGTVTVRVDATPYVGSLAGGTVTFVLPAPTPGIHVVVAEYGGSPGVGAAQGATGFVVRD